MKWKIIFSFEMQSLLRCRSAAVSFGRVCNVSRKSFSSSSSSSQLFEEPDFLKEIILEEPVTRSRSHLRSRPSVSQEPILVGRSHRLSVEMLPEEATEADVSKAVEEIVGKPPLSVEMVAGRKQRSALVLMESEEQLKHATTPSRLLFGLYVCRQRCPLHDARLRVASVWVGRLPFSQSAVDVEKHVRDIVAPVTPVKVKQKAGQSEKKERKKERKNARRGSSCTHFFFFLPGFDCF